MDITPTELATLESYAACARHAAHLLLRASRRGSDPCLRLELARRAADARRQAELWTDTIRAVGAVPTGAAPAHQSRYPDGLGDPTTPLGLFALTRVSERRLAGEMLRHFHRPGTHPIVRAALRRTIEEELRPDWVLPWLHAEAQRDPERVHETLQRYRRADDALPTLVPEWAPLRPAA